MNDYFSRTMAIASKMRLHGDTMTDVTIVEKILRSMTPKFDYAVCSIEELNDIDELSIDELQSSLQVPEQKVNRSNITEEQALKASTFVESSSSRGRGRGRDRGRGKGGQGNRDGSRQLSSFKNEYHSQGRGKGRD